MTTYDDEYLKTMWNDREVLKQYIRDKEQENERLTARMVSAPKNGPDTFGYRWQISRNLAIIANIKADLADAERIFARAQNGRNHTACDISLPRQSRIAAHSHTACDVGGIDA